MDKPHVVERSYSIVKRGTRFAEACPPFTRDGDSQAKESIPIACVLDLASLSVRAQQMGRERWRAVSDVAQVVANYLRCHPRVEVVRYPGLKGDPLFEEAAHTLVGGFGPIVAFEVAGEWYELTCEPADAREVVMALEAALKPGNGE